MIKPLETLPNAPAVQAAVRDFTAAPASTAAWEAAYEKAVAKATYADGRLHVPAGRYGPVGVMIAGLGSMARSGALDQHCWPRTSSTTPTTPSHSCSSPTAPIWPTWRRPNTSRATGGSGQRDRQLARPVLVVAVTAVRPVPPMKTSSNADFQVWAIMMILTLGLILLPFIRDWGRIPGGCRSTD